MARSKKENQDLTFVEFGKRIAAVRKEIFKLKQVEFAPLIGTTQDILSRLELGIGGNMHVLFDLVNFLNKSGFEEHLLFNKTFDIEVMIKNKEMLTEIEIAENKLMDCIKKLKELAA